MEYFGIVLLIMMITHTLFIYTILTLPIEEPCDTDMQTVVAWVTNG